MGRPYALLRAGFPYFTTLGMRRMTTFPVDIAIGDEGRLYVLCRGEGAVEIRRCNWDDQDLGTIGGPGNAPGKFVWPVSIIRDRAEDLYVSDEARHKIIHFSRDGKLLGEWGEQGSGDGQLNRPSGIAFDAQEDLYVVDTLNHRVQKFTRDGKFLMKFGSYGTGDGQFNMPWGIAIDDEGYIYVADWRNDRVQKFTPDGQFVFKFGRSGSGDGEFNRPAGIAVDAHGDIYVADLENNRVQQFNAEGMYLDKFIGDATLSKAGRTYILANQKTLRLREMASLEPSKRLRGPTSVRLDDQFRLYIADYGSHRIQVYRKESYPLSEADIAPPMKAPTLSTT